MKELDDLSYDNLFADAFKLSDKRIETMKKTPVCGKCESDQVQLVAWIDTIEWECRHCGHRMYDQG